MFLNIQFVLVIFIWNKQEVLLLIIFSIIGTVIVYIVVLNNVELDEIFVISNVTVTIVPIITVWQYYKGR